MCSVQEPEASDDGGTGEEGKKLEPAIADDGELLNDDLIGTDIDEGTRSDGREDDRVNVTSSGDGHADTNTKRCRTRKGENEPAAELEVVREGLDEGDAEG